MTIKGEKKDGGGGGGQQYAVFTFNLLLVHGTFEMPCTSYGFLNLPCYPTRVYPCVFCPCHAGELRVSGRGGVNKRGKQAVSPERGHVDFSNGSH